MKRLILAAAVLITTASTSLAGSLNPKSIPSDATWFLHLDAEAAKSSTFGKCIFAGIEKSNPREFGEIQTKLGIDPYNDVHSLTVFGMGARPQNSLSLQLNGRNLEVAASTEPAKSLVAIAEVTAEAAESLIGRLSSVGEAYQQINLGDYKVHAMIEPAGEGDDDGQGEIKLLVYVKPSDSAKRKTLVVSDQKSLLLSAIKTLAGDSASLAKDDDSSLYVKPRIGSLFVVSASDIEQKSSLWDLVQTTLNTDQQTALWLRYGENMPVQDIAKVLGKTRVSIRVMLFRARQSLAEKLDDTQEKLQQEIPEISIQKTTRTLRTVTGGAI